MTAYIGLITLIFFVMLLSKFGTMLSTKEYPRKQLNEISLAEDVIQSLLILLIIVISLVFLFFGEGARGI